MARIKIKCPFCGIQHAVEKEWTCGKIRYQKFEKCGHVWQQFLQCRTPTTGFKFICHDCKCYVGATQGEKHLGHDLEEIPIKRDYQWPLLWQYQREAIEFTERNNYTALLTPEQGLGKTVIAAKLLSDNREELLPALIVCPASLTPNWRKELITWFFHPGPRTPENLPLIHESTVLEFLENQNIHIVSDMKLAKKVVLESAQSYGFKTLIADECHHFKNDNSGRTDAFIKIAAKIPHRILLSATPVLNRTMEIFNSLHVVAPYLFADRGYLSRLCTTGPQGQPLSIAPHYKDHFNRLTKNVVYSITKKELFKKLPEKVIQYVYVDIKNQRSFVNLYNELLNDLEKLLAEKKNDARFSMDVIAIMVKLWQCTAIAKTPHTIDRLIEFLENTEPDQKIAVGTHHVAPRNYLKQALNEKGYKFAEITSQDPYTKQAQEDIFREDPKCRVLIASILGAGEGRNLQFCKNVIMMERYWNPKKEEQFQDRFYLRGLNPEADLSEEESVIIDYILADNTIDEFFTEMNNLKREVANSVTNKNYFADEQFVYQLARKVVTKRIKFVGV